MICEREAMYHEIAKDCRRKDQVAHLLYIVWASIFLVLGQFRWFFIPFAILVGVHMQYLWVFKHREMLRQAEIWQQHRLDLANTYQALVAEIPILRHR